MCSLSSCQHSGALSSLTSTSPTYRTATARSACSNGCMRTPMALRRLCVRASESSSNAVQASASLPVVAKLATRLRIATGTWSSDKSNVAVEPSAPVACQVPVACRVPGARWMLHDSRPSR